MLSKKDLEAIQKIVNTTFLNGIDQVVIPILNEILDKQDELQNKQDELQNKQDELQNDFGQLRNIVEEDVKRHDYFSEKITDHGKRITHLEHQV